MTRVLVVDNHDSFVHTLVGYLQQLGASVTMIESDAVDLDEFAALLDDTDAVLLSPGPGAPRDAGISLDAVRLAAARRTPVLGVCLGHQVIAEAFGSLVEEAPAPMHGMVSTITHDGTGLFAGLASPLEVGRYHSLSVTVDLPSNLRVTAHADDGTVMALDHATLPVQGVQFHPESVLTTGGYRLLANWLASVGDDAAITRSAHLHPLTQ